MRDRRLSPRWVLASLLAHVVLVALVVLGYGWRPSEPQQSLTYLLNIAAPPPVRRQVPVEAPEPPAPARRGRPLVVPSSAVALRDSTPPTPLGDRDGAPGGVPGGRGRAGGVMAMTPTTGDPRLWVRPLYIPEGGGRPISLDSAVRQRLMALADSLERNPEYDPMRPPSWTFERNGRTYGIDAQGIHLGTFTIPTAVLAFLPLPQGNIDQARANRQLMEMRSDILRAAARAQAEDDFRRAVREIRERKDRERREQREREQRERDRPIP